MSISKDILDELCSRFIINIEEEDREDVVRLCFQVEQAYWFYLDFFCAESANNPAMNMTGFAKIIFRHIPSLKEFAYKVDDIIRDWKQYKSNIPVYGAILLDESVEYCLLVQGFSRSWSFPKGKINYEEDPYKCAVREVEEETGFDIEPFANVSEFIERQLHNQTIRLYIVPNVPKDTKFQPKTRHEIRKIEWFRINDLPVNKKVSEADSKRGMKPAYFFLVIAFIKPLKKWITKFKDNLLKRKTKSKENFMQLLNQRLPGLDIEAGKMYSHPANQSSTTPVKPDRVRKSERRYSETALEDFSSTTGLSDKIGQVQEDQTIDSLKKKILPIKPTPIDLAATAINPKVASINELDSTPTNRVSKTIQLPACPMEYILKTPTEFENFKFDCQAIIDQFCRVSARIV